MSQYCIDYYVKPRGATRITKLGGFWGEKTEQTVMDEITDMNGHYYVNNDGRVVWLEVERVALGHAYLKTALDSVRLDDLSYLPRRYF